MRGRVSARQFAVRQHVEPDRRFPRRRGCELHRRGAGGAGRRHRHAAWSCCSASGCSPSSIASRDSTTSEPSEAPSGLRLTPPWYRSLWPPRSSAPRRRRHSAGRSRDRCRAGSHRAGQGAAASPRPRESSPPRRCRRSTIGFGVPAGANSPFQPLASKPRSPASSMVGTVGRPSTRRGPLTAIARSCPPSMNGLAVPIGANMTGTRPATRSVIAGALPR